MEKETLNQLASSRGQYRTVPTSSSSVCVLPRRLVSVRRRRSSRQRRQGRHPSSHVRGLGPAALAARPHQFIPSQHGVSPPASSSQSGSFRTRSTRVTSVLPNSGTVAHKIMQKYGFKEGQGLGKHEQGLSTALSVEKTSKRGGKIIIGDAAEKRTSLILTVYMFPLLARCHFYPSAAWTAKSASSELLCLHLLFDVKVFIIDVLAAAASKTVSFCSRWMFYSDSVCMCFILCVCVCWCDWAAGSSQSGAADPSSGGSAGWPPSYSPTLVWGTLCLVLCLAFLKMCLHVC